MIREYIAGAMRKATYEKLDDGSFYGEIPGLQGVLANAPRLETCREELETVLEEWILVRVARRLRIPPVEGIKLAVRAAR